MRKRPVARLWRWAALILLLWVGTFLRLHALDQLPPGLYHDEAFYGLDAQHVLHDGRLAIFFPGNNGREPLHIYLLAGALALLGDRVWALRLVSAFAGVLSIPLIYRLGRALLRGPRRAPATAAWIGVLAAALLTVSYWHVNFSRVIFRATDLVPMSLLAVWLLVEGARRQSTRLYVLSGLALGLCLYTYLSARLLPLVFLGLAAAQFTSGARPAVRQALRRPVVKGSVVALLTAALVFVPLGAYFLAHPSAFGQRSGSLSILSAENRPAGDPPPTLAENVLATARMFMDRGDGHARHNLPGRPAADALGLIGFWVGLGAAVVQFRQARSQLLLLWLGLMILPTTLSVEAPHFLRAIGALPPVCLLAADGLARLWTLLARVLPSRARWAPALWPAVIAGVTLISGAITYRDYFVRWASHPSLAVEFNVDAARAAQHALALSQTTDVVMPMALYQEPTALFFFEPVFGALRPIENHPGAGRPAVLLAARDDELSGLAVLRRLPGQAPLGLITQPVSAEAAEAMLARPGSSVVPGAAGDNRIQAITGVEAYVPGSAVPTHGLDVTFGNRFRLRGYDLEPPQPQPGDTLKVVLHWESVQWASEDYILSLQLQSPNLDNLAQLDKQPGEGHYNTTLWRPGSFFTDAYTLTVPADLAPGKYGLVAGFYEPATFEQLPSVTAAGAVGEAVRLGTFTAPDPALDLAAIPNGQAITAGDPALLKLRGYEHGAAVPGATLALTLYWEAQAPIPDDYTVFIHVLDEAGNLRAQQDSPPLAGRAPTSWWSPGEVFRDVHQVSLPADLPPGQYTVAVGLYYWATGERLPLFDANAGGAHLPDARWVLPEMIDLGEAAP